MLFQHAMHQIPNIRLPSVSAEVILPRIQYRRRGLLLPELPILSQATGLTAERLTVLLSPIHIIAIRKSLAEQ